MAVWGDGSLEEKPTREREEKWQEERILERTDKSREEETEGADIVYRVRKETVCWTCSRASSAGYRFSFPLRLVLGVVVVLQKSLGEGRECQCR